MPHKASTEPQSKLPCDGQKQHTCCGPPQPARTRHAWETYNRKFDNDEKNPKTSPDLQSYSYLDLNLFRRHYLFSLNNKPNVHLTSQRDTVSAGSTRVSFPSVSLYFPSSSLSFSFKILK